MSNEPASKTRLSAEITGGAFWLDLAVKPVQWLVFVFFLVFIPLKTAVRWFLLAVARYEAPRDPESDSFDVVCFSHVPWKHIWQRNHHTMTRLARARKVVYVEHFGTTYLHIFMKWAPWSLRDLFTSHPRVHIRHPLLFPGESRFAVMRRFNRWILLTHLRWYEWRFCMRNTVLWFYYPGAVYVLEKFKPAAVVYDIQDEYSAFVWAPRDISLREQQLLGDTDVIFAGTHALFLSKCTDFPRPSYFFPCGVEFEHFHAAAPETDLPLAEPPELEGIAGPRLIYMGLIDARIDGELIAKVARAEPEWQILMLGPVDRGQFKAADIATDCPNVHFLGSILYRRLPHFLAHSDICIMPWKVNELTRHINPTKTLEYLGSARPVVSIRLPDLEAFFGDYVALADTPDEFIAQCREALGGDAGPRVAKGVDLSRSYSWEKVVGDMEGYVRDAIRARGGIAGPPAAARPATAPYGEEEAV